MRSVLSDTIRRIEQVMGILSAEELSALRSMCKKLGLCLDDSSSSAQSTDVQCSLPDHPGRLESTLSGNPKSLPMAESMALLA